MSAEYGIVVSKNVMVPMRDGVRLAFDIYRPARDGGFVDGRFPTIMLHTPYDKTDKRYSEIADFFVPKGYNVVLVDLRDRYRSEASGVYYHAATPHTGRDGHDICEWIAAQPWSNGRIGTVGSSYGAITQVRTALERPPHLTAIWPDVVPTNSFQNQCREGGAMQGHMFWALFIHAQDAQDIADDPDKQQDVWNDLRDLRQLFRATPWQRGQTALRHVPPLEETLIDYYTRGAYDDYWSRIEHDYTRYWDQHADVPGTFSTGWYDPFPAADSEYFASMAAKNTAPQRLVIGPWSHVGMRGDATLLPRRRLRACERLGRPAVLRGAARVLRPLAPGRRDRAAGRRGAGADLRDGRRQRPQDGRGQARPRRRVAGRVGMAARAARRDVVLPPRRRLALDRGAGGRRRATALHLRPGAPCPDDRRPLLRGRRASRGRRRDGAGVVALPQPGAAAPRRAHARARPTRRRRRRSSARRSPTRVSPSGPTSSSSRPSRSRSRSR